MSFRVLFFLSLCLLCLPAQAADDRLSAAIAQFDAMKNDEALRSFVKLHEKNPLNAQIQFYLGRLHLRKFRYEQAVKWLRQAVELAPKKAEYRVSLCEALGGVVERSSFIDQIGIAHEVHENLLAAVEAEPDSVSARDGLMHYYLEAPTIAGGSSRKAMDQAAAIAKLNRGFGHLALGDIALGEKRYEDAVREYSTCAKLMPDNTAPLYQLVRTYQQKKDYPSAQRVLDGILSHFPNETAVYYHQAENLILSGEISDRAVKLLEAYIRKGPRRDEDPLLTQAYLELGHVQKHLKRRFAARSAYKAALGLNADDEEVREALEAVD